MPHRDGLDVLRRIKLDFPRVAVLMLSTYPDKQYAVRSMKLGASGYLNKSADSEQMIDAIRRVATGGLFITPKVASQIDATIVAVSPHADAPSAPEPLSLRECSVLRLLVGGCTLREIAERLMLTTGTVADERAHILEKTGARNDVELALYAARHELASG
jgi:DNA-binding NarL/FixJ family response regulator